MKIKVAIAGYGNLGKGVECAVKQNNDMELCIWDEAIEKAK